jgi:hypothetical protein
MSQPTPNLAPTIQRAERAFLHGFQSLSEIVERAMARHPMRKTTRTRKRQREAKTA